MSNTEQEIVGILTHTPIEGQIAFRVGKEPVILHCEGESLEIFLGDTEDLQCADLTGSSKPKIIIHTHQAMGHIMADTITQICLWSLRYPEYQIIVNTGSFKRHLAFQDKNEGYRGTIFETDMIDYIIDLLQSRGADIVRVQDPYFLVNNAMILSTYCTFQSPELFKSVQDTVFGLFDGGNSKPYRKVYISRSKMTPRFEDADPEHSDPNNFIGDDKRIYNEHSLDKLFKDLGFEVLFLEELKSFEEQLKIMQESKVIAGVTGAGLTNQIFLKPNQTVIEITTPLYAYYKPGYLCATLHHIYRQIAMFVNHTHLSIPGTIERDGDAIAKEIANNKNLYDYLKSI